MVIDARRREKHHSCHRLHECYHRGQVSVFLLALYCSYSLTRPASCCNEAFKIATSSAAYLNNYFMLIGTDGIYSYTFEHEKRDDCPVCGGEALELSINSELTVEQLIEMLVEKQDVQVSCSLFILLGHTDASHVSVKSKNHLFLHLQRKSTSKLHPSSNKPRGPT